MKACVLHQIGDMRYEEVPTPVPERNEVLLRVRAAGICGSDIQRVFTKGTYHFPTIPGHEFAGEVVEVGADVPAGWLGKRAAVFPLIPCGHCPACEVGEYAQCAHYNYYGSRCDGGFAEYLAVKAWNLVEVPDAVSFEEAAMCEPAAVAIHALSQAGVGFGGTVAIFGAGTIGLMLAKVASVWGASVVMLIDIDEQKLDFARSLGFAHCFNSRETDAVSAIKEATGGRGADIAVEGTGAGAALENCLRAAAVFGTVLLLGNPLADMKVEQTAYWEILRKQLTLKGTWNSSFNGLRNDWEKALNCMPALDLSRLITHRYALSRCSEAFQAMRDPQEFTVKVMFVEEEGGERT